MEETKQQENGTKNILLDLNRSIILDGKVNEESVRKVAEKIMDINIFDEKEKSKSSSYVPKPIKLLINTYGGSLHDANFLIGVIRTSETPVHTYCYGKAMSAGFYIFVSGAKRFTTKLAKFMYHDASVGLHSTIEGLKQSLEESITLRDDYNDWIVSMTNIKIEELAEKNRMKEDWFMTGTEAVDKGVADFLIGL